VAHGGVLELTLGDLGDAVHQVGDLVPEFSLELVETDRGVLEDVMQEPGRDGQRIHMEVGQDIRHPDQMGQVIIAGKPPLALMGLLGKLIGFLDQGTVEGGFGRTRTGGSGG
jgi:hypothetical protein